MILVYHLDKNCTDILPINFETSAKKNLKFDSFLSNKAS